jgi:hypothetical protein
MLFARSAFLLAVACPTLVLADSCKPTLDPSDQTNNVRYTLTITTIKDYFRASYISDFMTYVPPPSVSKDHFGKWVSRGYQGQQGRSRRVYSDREFISGNPPDQQFDILQSDYSLVTITDVDAPKVTIQTGTEFESFIATCVQTGDIVAGTATNTNVFMYGFAHGSSYIVQFKKIPSVIGW